MMSRLFERILNHLNEDNSNSYYDNVIRRIFACEVNQHKNPVNIGITENRLRIERGLKVGDDILASGITGQPIDGDKFVAEVDALIQANLPQQYHDVAHRITVDYVQQKLGQN